MPQYQLKLRQYAAQGEGRLLLAIRAIKSKEVSAIHQAANQFNVIRCRLARRLRGTTNRAVARKFS
jgi:hypothetical protein